MALIKEIRSPEKTVLAILITPPDNLRSKIRPAPTHTERIAILVRNMVLALEPIVLKNKYSKVAQSKPAAIPKIHNDFCCIIKKIN
jgi:hypothetical protein